MEIASLCEITSTTSATDGHTDGDDDDDGGLFVTIECVGRVKLDGIHQQYPYPKFHFTMVEETEECLEECKLVTDNIDTFMHLLSRSDIETESSDGDKDREDGREDSKNNDDDNDTNTLLSRYQASLEHTLHIQHSPTLHTESMRYLSAVSWAAFTAIVEDISMNNRSNSNNLESYRMRALDYDNVFDRPKLAQYMLREKELRMQGMRLQRESECEREHFNTCASTSESSSRSMGEGGLNLGILGLE